MKEVEDYISSGILEQFVLEELSTAEVREVLAMAERYPEIREELVLIEDTLQCVAEDLAKAPPPTLRNRILTSISQEQEETRPKDVVAKKNKKIYYWQYGVAATFTLKLVFIAIAANFWMKWQNTEDKLDVIQEQYGSLEQRAQQATQALLAISDPAFETFVLRGQAAEADARVLVYWNEETLELLVNAAQLPPNPNEQYQLWGTVAGEIVSLGGFEVEPRTSLPQIISFKGVDGLSNIFISVEPKGGSDSPSQDQIYSGR